MKAVAAFSFATDNDRVDAFQEYQQAVSLLKSTVQSTEDLVSDGSFLTHFLLLIHEVCSARSPLEDTNDHRSQQQRNHIGDSIFQPFYKFQVFDVRSTAVNDTPIWFGGFV